MLDQQSTIKVQQKSATSDSILSMNSATQGKSYSAVPFQFRSAAPDALEDVEKSSTNDAANEVAVPIFPTVSPIAAVEPANPIFAKLAGSQPSVTPVQFATNLTSIKSLPAPIFQFSRDQPEQEEEEDLTETKIKADPIQQKPNSSNGLPADVQAQMEGAFSADFSDVSIHANSESASKVGALAYTQGSDIHFAAGQYDPQSAAGQELLGHELTHVVQQREGRVQPTTTAAGLPVNDDQRLEAEAVEGGRKVVQGKFEPFVETIQRQEAGNPVIQRTESERPTQPGRTPQERATETVEYLRGRRGREVVHRGGTTTTRDEYVCVRLLRENHDVINEIIAQFDGNLRTYIKDNFTDWDFKIKATALLYEPTYLSPWTQIALSIIPPLTRDAEFFRIMNHLTDDQRHQLTDRYNSYFSDLGEGALLSDVQSDFDGQAYQRAHILLYRNLTDADNLYLATAGQVDTDVSTVLGILRRKWGEGISSFGDFLNQWNPNGTLPNVIHSGSSLSEYFDTLPMGGENSLYRIGNRGISLMYTTLSELSGSSHRVAQSIFLEYINGYSESVRERRTGEARTVSGWEFTFEEQSRLRVARAELESGASYIDDSEQISSAISTIIDIYQGRVTRLSAIHAEDSDIQAAQRDLELTRSTLQEQHLTSWTGGVDDNSRLSLYALNDADRLWLKRNSREDYATEVRESFLKGNIQSLVDQSLVPHEENGQVIRRRFAILEFILSSDPHYYLLSSESQMRRGRRFIDRYLEERSYENMQFISDFLLHTQFSGALLEGILGLYPRHENNTGRPLSNKSNFVLHLRSLRFDEFTNFPRIRDAFDPAGSRGEALDRARRDRVRDQEAAGIFGGLSTAVSDATTGEDTDDLATASLDRLSIFAQQEGVDSEMLDLFRDFYGPTTDLMAMEQEEFRHCLADLQAGRAAAAGAIAAVISTAVEAALSPLITPVGAAFVGQICGIMMNELMNAERFNVLSADSLQQVVVGTVSAGGGMLLEEGSVAARLINGYSESRIVQGAIREGFQASISGSATLMMSGIRGQLTPENIMSELENMVASAVAGAIIGHDIHAPETQSLMRQLREEVLSNVLQNIAQQEAHLLHNLATGQDIDGHLEELAQAILEGLRDGCIEAGGEHVGEGALARYRAHRERRESSRTAHEASGDSGPAVDTPAPQDRTVHRDVIVPPAPVNPQPAPVVEPNPISGTQPADSELESPTLPDFNQQQDASSIPEADSSPIEQGQHTSSPVSTDTPVSSPIASAEITPSAPSAAINQLSSSDIQMFHRMREPERQIVTYNDLVNSINQRIFRLEQQNDASPSAAIFERLQTGRRMLDALEDGFNRHTVYDAQTFLINERVRSVNQDEVIDILDADGFEYIGHGESGIITDRTEAMSIFEGLLRADPTKEYGIWVDNSQTPPQYRIIEGSTFHIPTNFGSGNFSLVAHTHPNFGQILGDVLPSMEDFLHMLQPFRRRPRQGDHFSSDIYSNNGTHTQRSRFYGEYIATGWMFGITVELNDGGVRVLNIPAEIILNNRQGELYQLYEQRERSEQNRLRQSTVGPSESGALDIENGPTRIVQNPMSTATQSPVSGSGFDDEVTQVTQNPMSEDTHVDQSSSQENPPIDSQQPLIPADPLGATLSPPAADSDLETRATGEWEIPADFTQAENSLPESDPSSVRVLPPPIRVGEESASMRDLPPTSRGASDRESGGEVGSMDGIAGNPEERDESLATLDEQSSIGRHLQEEQNHTLDPNQSLTERSTSSTAGEAPIVHPIPTPIQNILPPNSRIIANHPNHIIVAYPDGSQRIFFDSYYAVTQEAPTTGGNDTTDNLACLNVDGQVYVYEGRHRAIGAALGSIVSEDNGGIPHLPRWLNYSYDPATETGGVLVRELQLGSHSGPAADRIETGNVETVTEDPRAYSRRAYFGETGPNGNKEARYFADFQLHDDGFVEADVRLRLAGARSSMSGREEFHNALEHFRLNNPNLPIVGFRSTWGDGDNLELFRNKLQEEMAVNPGRIDDNYYTAVLSTHSYRWASVEGFTSIRIIEPNPLTPNPQGQVVVEFT